MKRIAIKLMVFLLLGAVVNVGVAWGCMSSEPDGLIDKLAGMRDHLIEPWPVWFEANAPPAPGQPWQMASVSHWANPLRSAKLLLHIVVPRIHRA